VDTHCSAKLLECGQHQLVLWTIETKLCHVPLIVLLQLRYRHSKGFSFVQSEVHRHPAACTGVTESKEATHGIELSISFQLCFACRELNREGFDRRLSCPVAAPSVVMDQWRDVEGIEQHHKFTQKRSTELWIHHKFVSPSHQKALKRRNCGEMPTRPNGIVLHDDACLFEVESTRDAKATSAFATMPTPFLVYVMRIKPDDFVQNVGLRAVM
jgi:hypothetical protein